jgi:hypothetical protein
VQSSLTPSLLLAWYRNAATETTDTRCAHTETAIQAARDALTHTPQYFVAARIAVYALHVARYLSDYAWQDPLAGDYGLTAKWFMTPGGQ